MCLFLGVFVGLCTSLRSNPALSKIAFLVCVVCGVLQGWGVCVGCLCGVFCVVFILVCRS